MGQVNASNRRMAKQVFPGARTPFVFVHLCFLCIVFLFLITPVQTGIE